MKRVTLAGAVCGGLFSLGNCKDHTEDILVVAAVSDANADGAVQNTEGAGGQRPGSELGARGGSSTAASRRDGTVGATAGIGGNGGASADSGGAGGAA